MMAPEHVHRDVGAYALGVLDPRDSARFEEHLTLCRSCPRELEQLSSVVVLLSHVSADSLVFADRSARDPRRTDALVDAVRVERRRSRARHGLTLAACLALLVAGAVVAVSLWFGRIGSPDSLALSPTADKRHAVNDSTGAEATVQVDGKRWGSVVTLEISHVRGPVVCHLMAISTDGRSEVVMGWSVPPEGYGTPANPRSLVVRGGTEIGASSLSRLEVRTTTGTLLVSVPT
jgi:Putative zinc-finger